MKKYIIGRNDKCDIVIPDTSDLVSRKQAELTIPFLGKMTITDTSNNGTFVNGEQLEKGKSRAVTRNDKVCFARVADFDWSTVPDPYKGARRALAAAVVLLAIVVGALTWWLTRPAAPKVDTPAADTVKVDSPKVEEVAPQPVAVPVAKPAVKPQPRKATEQPKAKEVPQQKSIEKAPAEPASEGKTGAMPII